MTGKAKDGARHERAICCEAGQFLSVKDPDTFFFMRGFPDLPSREAMKAKFYEGELWKRELENVLLPMLEEYDVVVVEDADGLVHWK